MSRSITVITTFSSAGWEEYGQRMVETFVEHWDKDIKLKIYYEIKPNVDYGPQVEWVDLHASCPDLVAFKEKHKNNPYAKGHRIGMDPQKDKGSYLWDAIKFSHKSYCVSHEALKSSSDLIVWLDADVVTHNPVSKEFIESLLPKGNYCSYLGRMKIYPECGFVIYDTTSTFNDSFMKDWQDMYNTDKIFDLVEYHDCIAFDTIKNKYAQQGLLSHNISEGHPHRPGVHVFINSPLGHYMDHLKGKRKKTGHSKASDIYYKQTAEYWNKIK